ncbi:MAG: DUF1877 family protein [Micromonosporaceae bacterium]
MALDLGSYPVRLGSAPMRLIRADARAWQAAVDHPPFCDRPADSLPEVSRQLQAEFPDGLERDWNFPDRSYGQAEYLLDCAGYRTLKSWPERERSLPYRIIEGDEEFAVHATGVQGITWRCSTAAFLAEAVATIGSLDPVAARREFSVAEMAALGVYKVHPSHDDDEVFAGLLDGLRRLAAYYRGIVDRGLDLIIVKD